MEVHVGFISRDRGYLPDLFMVQIMIFFFYLCGFVRGDEEIVGDREDRQQGGEFESPGGSVQGKDHEIYRSIFHEPLTCWRITGLGCTKY